MESPREEFMRIASPDPGATMHWIVISGAGPIRAAVRYSAFRKTATTSSIGTTNS